MFFSLVEHWRPENQQVKDVQLKVPDMVFADYWMTLFVVMFAVCSSHVLVQWSERKMPAFVCWQWHAAEACNKTISNRMLIFPPCLNQQMVAAQMTTCFCFSLTTAIDVESWSDSNSSVWLLINCLSLPPLCMCMHLSVRCVIWTNSQKQLFEIADFFNFGHLVSLKKYQWRTEQVCFSLLAATQYR